jgi:hypothetical protein
VQPASTRRLTMRASILRPGAWSVLTLAVLLLGSGAATAQTADAPAVADKSSPPPGGDVTGFYGGNVAGGSDSYDGRLVCLRNDRKFSVVGPAEECPSGKRVYALQRSDGEMTHPLLAADEAMLQRFDRMRGQEVQVQGKLYDATGMILVSAITADERDVRK